ncbi:hypothetical protein AB0D42_40150 [Streptomyces sp. NPDC048304]|uniref:hypothetical protein n=1 Tax=Streptomyces sp. NPDC048304 TaxID=3154820 RepID=UPI0033E6526A
MTGKLKPIGFYCDTEYGVSMQPTLAGSIGKFSGNTEGIVSYLRAGHHYEVSGSGFRDECHPEKPVIGALSIQTDGVWIWPSSYPYYVENYQAEVPDDLLRLAEACDWVPPSFSDDVDFEDFLPFEE